MLQHLLFTAREEAEHATRELPMSPIWFGVIAMAVFLGLFAFTWAFRSVATKH